MQDGRKVRPALNVDLDAVLLTSSAEGGKLSGAEGEGALLAQQDQTNQSGEWKLTTKDQAHSGFSVDEASIVFDEPTGTFTVPYHGAATGEKEYLSALIQDSSGAITYYGRLAQAASESEGTVRISTKGKLNEGDTLYLFNEQCNGDKKTDYASDLQEIPRFYTVSFDSNGHGAAPDSQKIREGTTAVEPASPSVSGWIFGGWYRDAECTQPFAFSTLVSSDITLYAKWTKESAPVIPTSVFIRVDPNGGTWPDGTSGVKIYRKNVGSLFTLPAAPDRSEHTFLYWKGSAYQPGDDYIVPAEGHTFIAEWKKNESDLPGGKPDTGTTSENQPDPIPGEKENPGTAPGSMPVPTPGEKENPGTTSGSKANSGTITTTVPKDPQVVNDPGSVAPKTGDADVIGLYGWIAVGAAAGLFVMRKTKRTEGGR